MRNSNLLELILQSLPNSILNLNLLEPCYLKGVRLHENEPKIGFDLFIERLVEKYRILSSGCVQLDFVAYILVITSSLGIPLN